MVLRQVLLLKLILGLPSTDKLGVLVTEDGFVWFMLGWHLWSLDLWLLLLQLKRLVLDNNSLTGALPSWSKMQASSLADAWCNIL